MADKEWTLMFYFACDNALTPGVVSQLKALKLAGYHPEVNVVAHFDPQNVDTPTHVFDVNLINKLENPGKADVGFTTNDPFIRSLIEDKLWRDQTGRDGKITIRELLQRSLGSAYDPPKPPPDRVFNGAPAPTPSGAPAARRPKERGPKESLADFLKFCSESYPAKHYMLFILGHGMVVGNDVFLFDEHVDSDQQSLSLIDLGEVLNEFATAVRGQEGGAEFELVSFHSCSVSSLEVAHELQFDQRGVFRGTANYMLASQGPAFVGSWPYREILIRVLNDVDELKGLDKETRAVKVKEMLVKIFFYILHNSSDFLLAGYSFQLTLCDLNKVLGTTSPLKELSDELIKGLDDARVKNLILLAHWEAISFWQENYTDLYDFCFRLRTRCEEFGGGADELSGLVERIRAACDKVIAQLVAGDKKIDDLLIVRATFAGPTYQYSHGLSAFFPWARPTRNFMDVYEKYRFAATSWPRFLNKYFDRTERETRREEEEKNSRAIPGVEPEAQTDEQKLKEDIVSICFNNEGPLNTASALDGPRPVKTDVRDPTGDVCTCGSIKNYPHDTRPRRQKARKAAFPALPVDPETFTLF